MSDRPTAYSHEDLAKELGGLDGWGLEDGGKALLKTFKFTDFAEAFGFMANCAVFAEGKDHHPEWFNVYNRVEVRLTTHEAGGITQLDVDTATYMNKVAG